MEDQKVIVFEVEKYNIKHFEGKLDKRFLPVELWMISEGQNINKSYFELDGMISALPKFYNLSISAKYEQSKDDFLGHEVVFKGVDKDGWGEYEYIEVPIGTIPESGNARIEVDRETGKSWIVVDALIWTERNRKVERLLKRKKINNISAEVLIEKDEWQGDNQIIKEFIPLSITFISNQRKVGIPKARGIVKDDQAVDFKNSLVLAFEAKDEDSDSGPIIIDLSKRSISNEDWGSVDKTELRNNILSAENSTDLVEKCYLLVEDGWETAPSEKLGYPVCQIKNDKLVYNRNGILTARRFLERNKDREYYSTVNSKLIKIEKKLKLWKELEYTKFEGGVVLEGEKINAIFSEKYGDKLFFVGDNFIVYTNEDNRFIKKNFSVESNEAEEETLLVCEEETELSCVAGEFGCGEDKKYQLFVDSNKMYEFISSLHKTAKEKEENISSLNKQFEEIKGELSSEKEKVNQISIEKSDLASKNAEYEREEKTREIREVIVKYKDSLDEKSANLWFEKASDYEDTVTFEKDILFFMVQNNTKEDVLKMPLGQKKAKAANNGQADGLWSRLAKNAKI